MHVTKQFVFIVSFFVSVCFALMNGKASETDESGIDEAAVKILESCYGNHLATLGLVGNVTGGISKTLWSRGYVPATLMDDTAEIVNNGPVLPISRYKLQFFVVSISSSTALTKTLQRIMASIWWNHMADFLILEQPQWNDGCSNAFEMLWAAWEMNILNANLICYQQAVGRLIYTYNPYTTQAPGTWKIDKTYSGINDHPWTMFVKGYGDGDGVCDELNFEKTNDLGGYKIRATTTAVPLDKNHVKSDRASVSKTDQIAYDVVYPTLNATSNVHTSTDSIGYVDDEGNAFGVLGSVINGSCDFGLRHRYLTTLKYSTFAYPQWQSSLHMVTQHRGYKSQISKIISVIDRNSRFGLGLVCLISTLFFKFLLHQPIIIACLSTLRVICNGPLPELPSKVAPRIYLGSLFLVALTIHGIYDGRLASLLTKQERLQNVDTKRDLNEFGHKIFGHKVYSFLFKESEFEGRFIGIENFTCSEYVLRDPRAACVADLNILLSDVVTFQLHVSTDPFTVIHAAYPIRPNWPLERRFNTIISRSTESYWIKSLYDKATAKLYRTLEISRNENEEDGFKNLTLEQLSFAFAILGIGLGCATISFIFEVGMGF